MSRTQIRASRATTGNRAAWSLATAGRSTTGAGQGPRKMTAGETSCLPSSAAGAACTGGAAGTGAQETAQHAAPGLPQQPWHPPVTAGAPHAATLRTGPRARPASRRRRKVRRGIIGNASLG